MDTGGLIWKQEKYFFILIVLVTAVPILVHPYFPTVDGPAHLYNGNLLRQYLFKRNNFLLKFFEINKHLNSNIIDHIWFAVVGLFLPPDLTEKSMLLFYILSMPYSFRYLVKKINTNKRSARLSAYLIFPFIYSFTFRIGFFNFCTGIPLIFWALGYWIEHRDKLGTNRLLVLSGLVAVIYISHIFNFLMLGIILTSAELQHFIKLHFKRETWKRLKNLIFIFLPGIVLVILFLIANSKFKHAPSVYLEKRALAQMLLDLAPVITLNHDQEISYTRIIGFVLLFLLVSCIVHYYKTRLSEPSDARYYWLIPAVTVLILLYTFPDWIDSGGDISIRFGLFFFLILIILIAANELSSRILGFPICIILITHILYIYYHNEQTRVLSNDAETLAKGEQYMEGNTILLPLNYSKNWIQTNNACYMTSSKNIINLDNYEPTKPHFPLMWKKGEAVNDFMPLYGQYPPGINIENYEYKTHHRIDYISRFCYNSTTKDSCTLVIEREIEEKFSLIYRSANKRLEIFKRKPNT